MNNEQKQLISATVPIHPSAFIQKQYKDLLAKGIEKESILFEEFGPALLQLN